MKKEELNKVKEAITALHDSLSHYIGWNSGGYEAYWDSYEDYEKFNNNIVDACNIIEKELKKMRNKEIQILRQKCF